MPDTSMQATAERLCHILGRKAARRVLPADGSIIYGALQLLEMNLIRIGLSTASAMIAATMLRIAAT